jgi:type I restriction enzyme M protein
MSGGHQPKTRRDELFRIHSALRSADNLRPDEAFDELVKLYRVWSDEGPRTIDVKTTRRFEIQLSEVAAETVVPALWELLESSKASFGSDLFQELAAIGVRSGLGQYFTPQPVADAIASYLDPKAGERWLDPFLGSGILLGAIAVEAAKPVHLHGSDLDHRVLGLAELEARFRHPQSTLKTSQISALEPAKDVLKAVGAPAEGVDGVVTNPPFGAVDLEKRGSDEFELALGRKTPIEILGLEQALRLLRPGGRLGIVLPQSVLSNQRLRHVRRYLREKTSIDGVLSLPGESFAMFDGVGKASVIFATKSETPSMAVWFGRATSIGWDSTGRAKGTNDVGNTAIAMRDRVCIPARVESKELAEEMDRNVTAEWQLRSLGSGVPLVELTTSIFTGRSPARAQYCDSDGADVMRVVKVANLTGHGIDWAERERSFATFKRRPADRILAVDDIALTSSAHHPRYIAAKVDVVDQIPDQWEGRCLPSGEVLVIRPDSTKIEVGVLLLWLRSAQGRSALQACVTGQTAHLHSDYVGEVLVPRQLTTADLSSAAELLRLSLAARRNSEELQRAATEEFTSRLAAHPTLTEAA